MRSKNSCARTAEPFRFILKRHNESPSMILWIIFLVLPLVMALAVPSKRPWYYFFLRFVVCLVGIVIPIAVFLVSALMTPEWVGEAKHGWMDCFPVGKLALTPIVLWASVSLYRFQVLESTRPVGKGIVQGL